MSRHVTRARAVAAAAILCGALGAASAQQSVYVNQVDPTAAAPARRTTAPNAFDQILSNIGTSGSATAAPGPGVSAQAYANPGLGPYVNSATINQSGFNNSGTATQYGTGQTATTSMTGMNNVVTQMQSGAMSNSEVLIVGNDNRARTEQSSGSGNSAYINLNGDRNNVTQQQIGSNLSYSLSVVGSDKNITVVQQGIGQGAPTVTTGLPAAGVTAIPSRTAR